MPEGFYTPVSVIGALCCKRCGALVYNPDAVPLGDPSPRQLHDAFHDEIDALTFRVEHPRLFKEDDHA